LEVKKTYNRQSFLIFYLIFVTDNRPLASGTLDNTPLPLNTVFCKLHRVDVPWQSNALKVLYCSPCLPGFRVKFFGSHFQARNLPGLPSSVWCTYSSHCIRFFLYCEMVSIFRGPGPRATVEHMTDGKISCKDVAQNGGLDCGKLRPSYSTKTSIYNGYNMYTPYDDCKGWVSEQCFTSPPTQYRLYGRRYLQVKSPNQQYQSTEGRSTKDKENNENNYIQIYVDNNAHTKRYTQNKHSKSPSLQLYGVTRGQLPQRAGSLGLTAVGLPPRYPRL